jgi:hypothetical protein
MTPGVDIPRFLAQNLGKKPRSIGTRKCKTLLLRKPWKNRERV